MRTRLWVMVGVLVVAITQSDCRARISLAVKRGQKTVDPSALPFASLTIATDGIAVPIQRIVLENLDRKDSESLILVKFFDSKHPDVLTAIQGDHRSLTQIILKLKTGRYRIKLLEFNPPSAGGVSSMIFEFDEAHRYWFVVKPGCVNYVGSLVIHANWLGIVPPRLSSNPWSGPLSSSTSFPVKIAVEHTEERDAKWARDLVPGLVNLPATNSPLSEN